MTVETEEKVIPNYCYEDSEGGCVLNEDGELPWEECLFVPNTSDLEAVNTLLADGFYIYSAVPVGNSMFIRLRSVNSVEI